MRRRSPIATLPIWGLVVLLAGCGSGTKVVSTPSSPSAGHSAKRNGAVVRSSATSRSTTSASLATTVETATSTRTSSAPAFAQQESTAGALTAAVATVKREGYTPNDTAEYHSSQTLRVLTASRTGGGHQQRAFFFIDGRYIGTDASQPSASLKVLAQGDATVTLGYGLYRSGDSPCCPSGGEATVRFALDNGGLRALDPIPPARSASGLARL